MVQKIHSRGVIWVPSSHPQAGHLPEKQNEDLAVQYEDCPWLRIILCYTVWEIVLDSSHETLS